MKTGSNCGSLTLPPAMRRKLGLDKLSHPLLLVEGRNGGLFLQPTAAMPRRDIPKAKIGEQISPDEAALKAVAANRR